MQSASKKVWKPKLKAFLLRVILPLLLGVLVFVWVFSRFDFKGFTAYFYRPAIWYCLGASLLINFACHWLRAYRWTLLLRPIGEATTIRRSLAALMIGYLVSLAIPRAGELSRVALVSGRHLGQYTRILGTVIAERLTDVVCLLLMIGLVTLIQWNLIADFVITKVWTPLVTQLEAWGGYWLIFALLTGGFCLALLLFWWFSKKREDAISGISLRLAEGIGSIRKLENPLTFLLSTLGIWFCYFLLTYVWFWGFEASQELGPMAGATLHTFGSMARSIPLVAGSAGAYHEFFAAGASLYHIGKTEALSMALLVHGASTLFTLLSGGLSWLWLSLRWPGEDAVKSALPDNH